MPVVSLLVVMPPSVSAALIETDWTVIAAGTLRMEVDLTHTILLPTSHELSLQSYRATLTWTDSDSGVQHSCVVDANSVLFDSTPAGRTSRQADSFGGMALAISYCELEQSPERTLTYARGVQFEMGVDKDRTSGGGRKKQPSSKAQLEEEWNKQKVLDLKAELTARGLDPNGKKSELVERLVTDIIKEREKADAEAAKGRGKARAPAAAGAAPKGKGKVNPRSRPATARQPLPSPPPSAYPLAACPLLIP